MFCLPEQGIERGLLKVVLRVVLAGDWAAEGRSNSKQMQIERGRESAGHPLNGEHCANGRVIGARSHAESRQPKPHLIK